MKEGGSMRAYVNRVEELGERLVELDASVEDNDWIMTLLAGLGEAWSTVITMLDGTQDTWKKEQVVARLINEEARRTKLHSDAIGAAHFSRDAKAKGTGHFKRRNDGNNRGSSNGSAATSSSSRGGSANANRARAREGACRFCKKTGHWWRGCTVKPANWRPSSSDDNRRAHVATCDNNDQEFIFVASGTTVGGVDAWVLDTGATQHMTACATLLNNRQEQRTHGQLAQQARWATGDCSLRTTGAAGDTTATSLQPPPLSQTPFHTPPVAPLTPLPRHPLARLPRLPHIHPPQRQLQQWETEEEEEQGSPHTPVTPIRVTPKPEHRQHVAGAGHRGGTGAAGAARGLQEG
ncbi:unnamed protein product [Closterium sp. NIES-54]